MPKPKKTIIAPLYSLNAFSARAERDAFYIERMDIHLKEHEFISKPHRHEFYLLLFITKGGGTHYIDFEAYNVTPGSFFWMTPGQVHSWTLDQGTDGFIVFFQTSFYRMTALENNLLEVPFLSSGNPRSVVNLEGVGEKQVSQILECMYAECKMETNPDLRILRSYLEILLLKVSRAYLPSGESNSGTTYKMHELQQLIEKHFIEKKHPREYAELMHLSAAYLNSLCKSSLGKTLTELISERLVLEAKRMLSYSNLNVSEIAHKLNFSDPSYFIRFFKKNSGVTPEQFKERLRPHAAGRN